ncbi:UNVERIFIED_CONTAM: hypothetical protein K2H54_002085 [Gekko kuhli]
MLCYEIQECAERRLLTQGWADCGLRPTAGFFVARQYSQENPPFIQDVWQAADRMPSVPAQKQSFPLRPGTCGHWEQARVLKIPSLYPRREDLKGKVN